MYMDTGNYVTIQLLLQRMLEKIDFLKNNASAGMLSAEAAKLPGEAIRMAMCVLTVAPMLLVFPRFRPGRWCSCRWRAYRQPECSTWRFLLGCI